jgi:hypothetical protein
MRGPRREARSAEALPIEALCSVLSAVLTASGKALIVEEECRSAIELRSFERARLSPRFPSSSFG